MQQITWCLCASLCFLVAVTSFVDAQDVVYVSPLEEGVQPSAEGYDEQAAAEREKRKVLDPIVQASFGVKSKLLGLLFGKVNQFIDFKTHLVQQLDKKNIALNKQLLAKPCDIGTGGATGISYPK